MPFLRRINRQDLVNYISTHYSASRIVLAAAGGVEHDDLVQLAEKHFSGLPQRSDILPDMTPCRYTGSEVSSSMKL